MYVIKKYAIQKPINRDIPKKNRIIKISSVDKLILFNFVLINWFKSKLKYSRNININLQKEDIFFHMSDIHFEIDFELLGPKQYNIWLEFFSLFKDSHLFLFY